MEKLDLKSLTLKLLMLIALVSAQKGQSIHMLDTACMKVNHLMSFHYQSMSNKAGLVLRRHQ